MVGGTKNFWFDVIDKINPDLIIANKEENYKEGIEQLMKKYPVWVSDVANFDQALQMIASVGSITDREAAAASLTTQIELNFEEPIPAKGKRALYLIWQNPWMAAGCDTFIHAMLEKIGLINCVSESRYPTLSENQIRELDPELILLSSEPYPFQQKHVKKMQEIHPLAHVLLADGEYFSWFGSRMRAAPEYFNHLMADF